MWVGSVCVCVAVLIRIVAPKRGAHEFDVCNDCETKRWGFFFVIPACVRVGDDRPIGNGVVQIIATRTLRALGNSNNMDWHSRAV